MNPLFQTVLSNILPNLISIIGIIMASIFFVFLLIKAIILVFKALSLDESYGYASEDRLLGAYKHFKFSREKLKSIPSSNNHFLDHETGELLDEKEFFGDSFYAKDPLTHMYDQAIEFCENSDLTKSECNEVIENFNSRYSRFNKESDSEEYKSLRIRSYKSPIKYRKSRGL